MNNKTIKISMSIVLTAAVIFFIWKYIHLVKALKTTNVRLEQLNNQNEELKSELTQTQSQLDLVKQSLEKTQIELAGLNQRVFTVESDNARLAREKKELEEKMLILAREKETLERRLHSLKELKSAIRQVKLEMRQEKINDFLEKKMLLEEDDTRKLAYGNKGFLVKDGKSLYQSKVDIDVILSN